MLFVLAASTHELLKIQLNRMGGGLLLLLKRTLSIYSYQRARVQKKGVITGRPTVIYLALYFPAALPIVAVVVPLAIDRDFMLTYDDTNLDVVEL